jgi:predicted peptidase
LILFLHGAGERGNDVWKAATHGPLKHAAAAPGFPFIVAAPLCPAGRLWCNDVLVAMLKETAGEFAVAKGRIYLTGLSMGGYGTWSLGLEFPENFAAIAPICGGGEWIRVLLAGRDKPQALKSLAIWAFHGAKDPVVPMSESRRMVAAVKKAGVSQVKLTIYPNAEHDSWSETYSNPAFYRWFLKHERKTG